MHPLALSADQEAVLTAIKTRQYVIVFGASGTGKSTVRDVLSSREPCTVLGPTSASVAAATSGRTISYFLRTIEKPSTVQSILGQHHVIVIDDVQMVSVTDFAALDSAIRKATGKSGLPFGGLRVVLFGDMHQLQPLDGDGHFFETRAYRDMCTHGLFSVELRTQHRHLTAPDGSETEDNMMLTRILCDARKAAFTQRGCEFLTFVQCRPLPSRDVLRIFARRHDAEKYNATRLAQLPGDEHTLTYKRDLKIKIGARVVFTRNCQVFGFSGHIEQRAGAMGVVSGIVHTGILITLEAPAPLNTVVTVRASKRGGLFPLALAWALTVRMVHGQTLDEVIVDGTNMTEPGQAYVAISRVRSLDGLWITNLTPDAFEITRGREWRTFISENESSDEA